MGIRIVTLEPLWYIFICLAAAILFTWILYRKSNYDGKWLPKILTALRFLGLFLVFFLLLSPLIHVKLNKEIKPIVLVFFDKSNSTDSLDSRNAEADYIRQLQAKESDFDFRFFNFAGDVKSIDDTLKYTNETRLSAINDFVNEVYGGKNVKALIVATDGIANKGLNPMYNRLHKPVPIFTLGLGDTVQYPDIKISSVQGNSTVFFENEFVLEATVQSKKLNNAQVRIDLIENGKVLQTKTWNRSNAEDFVRMEFVVKPTEPGTRRFEVRAESVIGDKNPYNNAKNIFVQVTDTRRKIALLAHNPNPDISAIKRVIEKNRQYELKLYGPGQLPALNAFDLAICHGFPGDNSENAFVLNLLNAKKPFWCIISTQSNLQYFRQPEFGAASFEPNSSFNDAQPAVNPDFTEFVFSNNLESAIHGWPPLKSPYGVYGSANGFMPFINQRIGAVNTEMPLLGFTTASSSRQAWLYGEGLWRWSLADFTQHDNHDAFDELVIKTIQYLSTQEVNQKFKVYPAQNEIESGDNVELIAEYTDQNLQPNNSAECSVFLEGSSGYKKTFKMAKSAKRYRQSLGSLPQGNYSFKATLGNAEKSITAGKFTVTPSILEKVNTTADHALLRLWSNATGGSFKSWDKRSEILQELGQKIPKAASIKQEKRITELIKVKWIFVLIVLLFSLEWFVRKREGNY